MRRSEREARFEEFVLARSPSLLRLCHLLTNDRGLAEDLLQTALANCYRRWDQASSQGREEAYVRAAIVNTHISTVRRRRLQEILTLQLPETGRDEASAAVDDRDLLRRALAGLAPRTRSAVVLRHYVGLTEAEAAQTLSCSVGNIKRLSSRGLAQLRTAMGHQPSGASGLTGVPGTAGATETADTTDITDTTDTTDSTDTAGAAAAGTASEPPAASAANPLSAPGAPHSPRLPSPPRLPGRPTTKISGAPLRAMQGATR
ncbi:SigE family RNA polymerase sigma factor [Kitasatospora sp. NBC_01287]|uniref:SigE family RNA polymerase sigma factor n=1 Tax=Kitasatospora sp. NBC_01287 TaxID=2903573 RepID=UPI002253D1F3|nr:SigE family RNA polymerase sigma factor [Kitasatospora sp. NBC_01287]MCX4748063.1 SigE family RNA polymerase sigma factor [Kitasatospora sp. NBC_01287]